MALLRQRQPGLASMIVTDEEELRIRSKGVSAIDADAQEVIRQMQEAALDWESGNAHSQEVAIAMAAVQLGHKLKIVIVRSNPFAKTTDFEVFVNPKIVKYEGVKEDSIEGCLSIPNVYAKVPRWSQVRVRANNLAGGYIKLKCDGLLAKILQHETDHFKGKLFTDYITRADWLRLDDVIELQRAEQAAKKHIHNHPERV